MRWAVVGELGKRGVGSWMPVKVERMYSASSRLAWARQDC